MRLVQILCAIIFLTFTLPAQTRTTIVRVDENYSTCCTDALQHTVYIKVYSDGSYEAQDPPKGSWAGRGYEGAPIFRKGQLSSRELKDLISRLRNACSNLLEKDYKFPANNIYTDTAIHWDTKLDLNGAESRFNVSNLFPRNAKWAPLVQPAPFVRTLFCDFEHMRDRAQAKRHGEYSVNCK